MLANNYCYIWTGLGENLDPFICYLNTCDPNIKFATDISQDSVHFLDTSLFQWSTDSCRFVLQTHKCAQLPRLTHRNAGTVSPTVSSFASEGPACGLADFDKHMKSMAIHFIDRGGGDPIDLLDKATLKPRKANTHDLLHPAQSDPKTKIDWSILVTMFQIEDSQQYH